MTAAIAQALSAADIALAYHARTKHRLDRYAAGPETLDWDAQPNPFREFAGAPRTELPLTADLLDTRFSQIIRPGAVAPNPFSKASIAALLELSFGLSAWKEYGPDRWALRCNPSSGNLHPTEAYVLANGVAGIEDGLHHYISRDHALELRSPAGAPQSGAPHLCIGLSSIHWRESWKYGERAFRYCQLDLGHAIGALRYAATILGWKATLLAELTTTELAAVMGLDRAEDFAGAEREDPDALIAITPHTAGSLDTSEMARLLASATPRGPWTGRANLLDRHPMYRWPTIDEVSRATHGAGHAEPADLSSAPPRKHPSHARAADIVIGRRSAQRFDTKFSMSADVFYGLLDSLLMRPGAPWDTWAFQPAIHLVLFVHRVDGVEPGLYALPRHPSAASSLRTAMRSDFSWQPVDGAPAHVPLFQLHTSDYRAVAKSLSCHQAIAADSCFTLSMIAEFEPHVRANPWRYRQLHWEAGLLGHVLYLEAEAAGLRGTGIGCYFDDALHELIGLRDQQFQSLYHFTVGRPLVDSRITTEPGYPGRREPARGNPP